MRHIETFPKSDGGRVVVAYDEEWNEYNVEETDKDGVISSGYYTDDKQDALDTALVIAEGY